MEKPTRFFPGSAAPVVAFAIVAFGHGCGMPEGGVEPLRKVVGVNIEEMLEEEMSGLEVREGWSPVEFTNQELRAKGIRTGDGAQWFRSLAVDGADGNFMLWCTDVGGLFRSLDGGANWEPANVGFHSRGSAGSAIDPRNPRRAIVIAANSAATPFNGVYLSTDQAAFWKHVMPLNMAASLDCGRTQVVFDPSSYDSELGYTRVVYWSRLEEDKAKWGNPEEKTALYRSDDGGENWEEVPGGEVAAGARLAVHPLNGNLYAANRNGVMLSTDGGRTWETTLEGAATGVSVSPADPDTVWASQPDSIWRSGDGGRSWERTCAGDVLAVDENFMDGDI